MSCCSEAGVEARLEKAGKVPFSIHWILELRLESVDWMEDRRGRRPVSSPLASMEPPAWEGFRPFFAAVENEDPTAAQCFRFSVAFLGADEDGSKP